MARVDQRRTQEGGGTKGFTEFGEITQNNDHYAVQGHSRSPILVPIENSCTTDFLLVINTNLPAIFHRFRNIAFRSKIAIFGYPSCV